MYGNNGWILSLSLFFFFNFFFNFFSFPFQSNPVRSLLILSTMTNPNSKTLALFLLLLFSQSLFLVSASSRIPDLGDDDDLAELLAIDEAEENGGGRGAAGAGPGQGRPSEADLLSRAQRIVRELGSDNARRVVEENELVLLLGYAPWCPRSAELMPRFAEAAVELREMGSSVLVAKLDAERYAKAASALGIKGFPTILLFVNGTKLIYSGGFTK